ncbi:hypothetical protein ACFL4W_00340 [Planctomycetota bacterium]
MTARRFNLLHLAALLAIILLNLAAYANSFRAEWQFDDYPNIVENYSLHIDNFSELKNAHNREQQGINRIVCFYTFALDHLFHGLDVAGWHLTNVLIHISAGMLVYMIMGLTLTLSVFRPLSRKAVFLISLATALLWSLSPVQTQAVTYIVQRLASLGGMLYLLSLFLYIKGRRCQQGGRSRVGLLLLILALLPFGLALLTKEHTLTLPAFIFLYEFFFIRGAGRIPLKPLLGLAAALILVSGIMFAVNRAAFDFLTNGYEGREFTLVERLLTEMRILVRYLSLMAWPHPGRLNLDYNLHISTGLFSPVTTFLSMLFLLSITGLGFWLARRDPFVSFGIFWYLGNNVIESSILPLELMFEHRMYLPSVWVYAVAIVLLFRLIEPGAGRINADLRHSAIQRMQ